MTSCEAFRHNGPQDTQRSASRSGQSTGRKILPSGQSVQARRALALSEGLPRNICKLVPESFRAICTGWANWYLETGQYAQVGQSGIESSADRSDVEHRREMAADLDQSTTGASHGTPTPGKNERLGRDRMRSREAAIL